MTKSASRQPVPKSRPTLSKRDRARARAEEARRSRNQWLLVGVVAAVAVIAVTVLLVAILPPLDGVPLRRHF